MNPIRPIPSALEIRRPRSTHPPPHSNPLNRTSLEAPLSKILKKKKTGGGGRRSPSMSATTASFSSTLLAGGVSFLTLPASGGRRAPAKAGFPALSSAVFAGRLRAPATSAAAGPALGGFALIRWRSAPSPAMSVGAWLLSVRREAAATPARASAEAEAEVDEADGKKKKRKGRRGEPKGIMKPQKVSPELGDFVGSAEIPRTEALKVIWAHIKDNNLQDPGNKKIIVCDEKLKKIFGGRDRVGFLEISGLLNPHFQK